MHWNNGQQVILSVILGMADEILVNSEFTAQTFKIAFPRISKTPKVLYPCIHIDSYGDKEEVVQLKT